MGHPRFMITAAGSGSGKTTVACGLLQLFLNRGLKPASFKCGPDYIDPMFHRRILGNSSRNLDPYFTDGETLNYLLEEGAKGADLSLIEGVMGYYDGLGGVTDRASAYEVAVRTKTPVILVVDAKGMSLSAAALIKGYLSFRENHRIQGVILNRISAGLYKVLKDVIEEETGVLVLGYLPQMKEMEIPSRHLGLLLPDEVESLKQKMNTVAEVMEKTICVDELLTLAGRAEALEYKQIPGFLQEFGNDPSSGLPEHVKVAVARDEAFCFLYEENLELLEKMGAELIFFSPLHDREVPSEAAGLLLPGGYPELYAAALEENEAMRASIKRAVKSGMPCLAECGGFLYLQEKLEDENGLEYEMAGALEGTSWNAGRLQRFGYIELTAKEGRVFGMKTGPVRGHEFHYWESSSCGNGFTAKKPVGSRQWECLHSSERLLAGFPHLYYYSNPRIGQAFLRVCADYKEEHQWNG